MTTAQKVAFIGAGNMARALVRGCLERGKLAPAQLGASDVAASALSALEREHGIRTFHSNADAASFGDVVVLAVKPQVMSAALAEIAPIITREKLVISIAAGVPTARIEAALAADVRVIRAMPNTPAIVGEGATAICAGRAASDDDLEQAEQLFRSVGAVVRVAESGLDAVTGLSGSGPAYVFIAIEALADAGVRVGLSREVATTLAVQTLFGAAKLALESKEHPARLKDMVTSPGGTTIAGVAALERNGFRHALIAAVEAATERSRELGKG